MIYYKTLRIEKCENCLALHLPQVQQDLELDPQANRSTDTRQVLHFYLNPFLKNMITALCILC